jgi:hypothetical protein
MAATQGANFMAVFCAGCGTSIADGVNFCPACGKAVGASANQATPNASPNVAPVFSSTAPVPPPSGATKLILIVVGIIALIGILMIGSCVYIGYRVKKAAGDFTSHSKPYTGARQPCAFVSAQEATQLLDAPVRDAISRGSVGCDYVLEGDNHLIVQFLWKGGTSIMKLTHSAAQYGNKEAFRELPGLGDEAFLASGDSQIMMRKGDVLVTINLQSSGIGPEAGEKLAARIAQGLVAQGSGE